MENNNKLELPEGWVTEYIPGWDVNLTYNKAFIDKFFGPEPTENPLVSFQATFLDFSKDGN